MLESDATCGSAPTGRTANGSDPSTAATGRHETVDLEGPRHDVGTDRHGDSDANRGFYFAALADMGLRRQLATRLTFLAILFTSGLDVGLICSLWWIFRRMPPSRITVLPTLWRLSLAFGGGLV